MTDTPPPRFAFPLGLLVLAALFLSFMFAGALLQPPPVRAANAADQFDANVARERLARVLGDETPHPVDSAAQDIVRERLLTEIRAIGYEPEVRERFTCRANPRSPTIECGLVRNIIFSAGPQSGPAILAATHYDSVPAAPGASDAGIGIATWLEIARILRTEQLQRRVIFLISDGEEQALLGAVAFAQDPEMADVEALVNAEARGTRGPAIFFESNQPNADAVAAFTHAPRGIANSVMADIYALLPNSTDVTALTRENLDIVNLALLDGLANYHTPQDSLASFDVRSLQHMGDIALATTRSFAAGPDRGDASAYVYTDIASYAFISAPNLAAQIALGVSLLITFVAFWRAGKLGRWRALAAPLVALVLAGALATAFGFALSTLRAGETYWFAHPQATRAWCVLLALVSIIAALMILRVPRNAALVGAAGVLWFTLLGFAGSFFLPGVSILYAAPASLFALGALIALVWKPAQQIGATLAAFLAILIWAPSLFLIELGLGFEYPFASAILIAIASLPALGALAQAQAETRWRGSALVLGAGALVAAATAFVLPAATPQTPAALNLNYFVNTATNEARILAGAAARPLPPEFASAADFAPVMLLPGDRVESWAASAALAPAPAPTLTNVTVTTEGDLRTITARLAMNGAYRATLRMPRTAQPLTVTLNGVQTRFAETGGEGDFQNLACQGRACDGAVLELVVLADEEGATEWFIIGQTPGAPAPPSEPIRAARPATTTPIQFGNATVTLTPLQPPR